MRPSFEGQIKVVNASLNTTSLRYINDKLPIVANVTAFPTNKSPASDSRVRRFITSHQLEIYYEVCQIYNT